MDLQSEEFIIDAEKFEDTAKKLHIIVSERKTGLAFLEEILRVCENASRHQKSIYSGNERLRRCSGISIGYRIYCQE